MSRVRDWLIPKILKITLAASSLEWNVKPRSSVMVLRTNHVKGPDGSVEKIVGYCTVPGLFFFRFCFSLNHNAILIWRSFTFVCKWCYKRRVCLYERMFLWVLICILVDCWCWLRNTARWIVYINLDIPFRIHKAKQTNKCTSVMAIWSCPKFLFLNFREMYLTSFLVLQLTSASRPSG